MARNDSDLRRLFFDWEDFETTCGLDTAGEAAKRRKHLALMAEIVRQVDTLTARPTTVGKARAKVARWLLRLSQALGQAHD